MFYICIKIFVNFLTVNEVNWWSTVLQLKKAKFLASTDGIYVSFHVFQQCDESNCKNRSWTWPSPFRITAWLVSMFKFRILSKDLVIVLCCKRTWYYLNKFLWIWNSVSKCNLTTGVSCSKAKTASSLGIATLNSLLYVWRTNFINLN